MNSVGVKDKCQFAFVHWKNMAISERQKSHEGQVFQLKTENSNYLSELEILREQNDLLHSQIVSGREKLLIETARANTLSRKLKEFEVAKIMAVQTDACVNTSVDKVLTKKMPPVSMETEEEMMDIVRRRVEASIVEPVRAMMLPVVLFHAYMC
jgi:hypothetical protein